MIFFLKNKEQKMSPERLDNSDADASRLSVCVPVPLLSIGREDTRTGGWRLVAGD